MNATTEPLLRAIQAKIKLDPLDFDMRQWTRRDPSRGVHPGLTCRTAACICGWAVILHRTTTPEKISEYAEDHAEFDIEVEGTKILGLTDEEADRLFYRQNWPGNFEHQYEVAESAEEAADAACRRIDVFISSEGRE